MQTIYTNTLKKTLKELMQHKSVIVWVHIDVVQQFIQPKGKTRHAHSE